MTDTTAGLKARTAGLASAGNHVGVGTGGDANTPGTEVSGGSYARAQTTWPTSDNDGDWTGSTVTLQIPASTTVTWVGVWTAATGGTLLWWSRLAAAESFGSAGSLDVTPSLSTTNA